MRSLILITTLFLFHISAFSQVHVIKESIHFQFNKTKLTSYHKQKLDSIYNLMAISSDYNADIKGYTCTIGSLSVNKLVSKLRALSVYNYLVDKGADKNKLTYAGYAWENPIASNKTESGRSKNRRADLEVLIDMTLGGQGGYHDITDSLNTLDKDKDKPKIPDIPIIPPVKKVTLGPDFVNGTMPVDADKTIKSTSGVIVKVNKNSLVTYSNEPIEFDFKDYTNNYSVMDRQIVTTCDSCFAMAMHGAFAVSFVQDYQDVSINKKDPVIVSIPRKYNENIKLYNNPRNWRLDTVNELSYNDADQAYEIKMYDQNAIFALLENKADTSTPKFIKVRVVGVKPKDVKPYLLYDDCSMSNGFNQTGSNFIFPIVKESASYRIRATYTDFGSKNGPSNALIYDVENLEDSELFRKKQTERYIEYTKKKKPIKFVNEKMKHSDLCEEAELTN